MPNVNNVEQSGATEQRNDGWKLVPIEPTPEMVAAVFAGKIEDQDMMAQIRRRQAVRDNYALMIAASPEPPKTD